VTVIVDVAGLQDFSHLFRMAPAEANKAAKLAINQTALRKAIPLSRQAMIQQVSWPADYLRRDDRFGLAYRATDTRLEAGVRARRDATSLARFTGLSAVPRRGTKLSVRVQPGRRTALPRSFLLNLRSGNLGLAIRLKPGEALTHTSGAKLIRSGPLAGVALLYGPSVDQVFRTVAVDVSQPTMDYLVTEFLRQFRRFVGNAGLPSA
jgi:hypothetical protein